VRGGAGWCRNLKAQRKNSKIEFKVFVKMSFTKPLFFSLFSLEKCLQKRISKSCGGGVREGRGRGEGEVLKQI